MSKVLRNGLGWGENGQAGPARGDGEAVDARSPLAR